MLNDEKSELIRFRPSFHPGDIVMICNNQCPNKFGELYCRAKLVIIDHYETSKKNEIVMHQVVFKFVEGLVICKDFDENKKPKAKEQCTLLESEITLMNGCQYLETTIGEEFPFKCVKNNMLLNPKLIFECMSKRCFWRRRPPVPKGQTKLITKGYYIR